jgi:transmembrane sensor
VAVSVLAAGLELGRLLEPAQRQTASAAEEVFSTGIGAQKRVLLADGSQVVLNTDTRLRVQYTADRRLLVLDKGEAVFSVQHNPSRPFDVSAGKTVTRAVGTVFDIDFLPDKTTVSVLKGRVHVSAASVRKGRSQVELSAGQAVAYRAEGGIGPIAAADLARIGSWQAQRIEFDDVTLREAVEEFNRYCTTRVVFESPSIEEIRVSGVVNFGDVPAFTKALRGAFGIRSQRHGQVVVLLPPLPMRHTR